MKKLITLRGNRGSGKTTIARALQEKFGKNTMLLSQDVIRRDILKTNDGAGTRANDVLIMLLEYGHAHNELVILEQPMVHPAFRCRKSALRRKHLRVLF